MSIQIDQWVRSLIGGVQPGEAKWLELKVGQVIRGVVLQLLDREEAIVNIGGVRVRARLEAPLRQGESTWLQVQPNGNGQQIVLKPVSGGEGAFDDENVFELLRHAGVKETGLVRETVRLLRQEGIPLTKANIGQWLSIAESVPPGTTFGRWLEAAIVAGRRGLPVTRETVAALHSVMFGAPLAERLERLEAAVRDALRMPEPGGTAAWRGPASKALEAVRRMANLTVAATGGDVDGSAYAEGARAPENGNTQERIGRFAFRGGNALGDRAGARPAAPQFTPLRGRADHALAGASGRPAETFASGPLAPEAGIAGKAAPDDGAKIAAVRAAERSGEPRQPAGIGAETAIRDRVRSDANGQRTEHWISRLLKTVGVDYEHQVVKSFAVHPDRPPIAPEAGVAVADATEWAGVRDGASTAGRHAAADSLKSALLQLAGATDVPPALKEEAQQMLQHITGQQLLLASDRHSVFTHVTLFIPLFGADGQYAASVHVQSRKSRRGEIDARNCRLLFDLRMKSLGDTLVEAQVIDRNVYLQIHNDHPKIAELLDAYRHEIETALQSAGYRMLSLKCIPFPERGDTARSGGETAESAKSAFMPTASAFHVKPYKGVDVRV